MREECIKTLSQSESSTDKIINPPNPRKRMFFIFIAIAVITIVLVIIGILIIKKTTNLPSTSQINSLKKCGQITTDEVWQGDIHATCMVEVKKGVTLTIAPGTVIKFYHDRNYKTFARAGLTVYGKLIAKGTPEKQIWFTSDAKDPINGDWMGIAIFNSKDSIVDHAIVEFAEIAVSQFDSSVPIANSIIRWSNAEGLYAERSTPIIENNMLYENSYHEIALEQYNKNAIIKNNFFREGINGPANHVAIHHEKSSSIIENNYFKDYPTFAISAGMQSHIVINNNTYDNVRGELNDNKLKENIYDGSTSDISGNVVVTSSNPPKFDYPDIKKYSPDYIPGNPDDRFPYIYADKDETRQVVKKIGKELSFGWSLAYARNALWRFSIGSGQVGKNLDFIKINPQTDTYERFGNNEIISPRGLAYDGEYFYVNDGSLLKIFKFKLKDDAKPGDFIEITDRFDIPEKEKGGTAGLTSDSTFLYLVARDGSKIYKLDKNSGQEIGEIHFSTPGGSITWADGYFWVYGGCTKGLCLITKDGKLVGEIYPPAKDPWAMAWDGKYLWTLQRTNENWDDPKIYQVKILDDSLGPQ